jgi:hypothetical protein
LLERRAARAHILAAAMSIGTHSSSTDQDWRLKAELEVAGDARHPLDALVRRFRGPDVGEDVRADVPHDVVITHDGELLFAYAADEATLQAARSGIENALNRDGITAKVYISHWDEQFDDWRQTDPPPTNEQAQEQAAADRDAESIETRTLIASAGKMIRAEFEQSLTAWSDQLGVQCTIVEHPHLLTTQVAFTVTGPRHKLDEFADGLRAEELATIRAENRVIVSQV